ncbi:MAG: hypothetical protein ABIH76_05925 [Candidatus Bathyarchaeota archaeon]
MVGFTPPVILNLGDELTGIDIQEDKDMIVFSSRTSSNTLRIKLPIDETTDKLEAFIKKLRDKGI